MWAKINMAWRHRLPDLETAACFKILNRDLVPPYEKGGKYRYECPDAECDTWANLFSHDENNKWRFKFSGDSGVADLDAITLFHGQLRGDAAWKAFLDHLNIEPKSDIIAPKKVQTREPKWVISSVVVLIVLAATFSTWYFFFRHTNPKTGLELPDKPSIAVMPFTNLSADPQQEYFTDGIWMRVWETFKANYDLANSSIDEIDAQFSGSQSFFNWCQDFEMELINASIDSKEFAEFGVSYLNEFLAFFADEDAIIVNQFKSSLGEFYCRSGDQETDEKVMRELIRQYPDRMVGYIGMEIALSIKKMNDEALALEERLKILEANQF